VADTLRDLAVVIRSRFPVVQIETREETRMMRLLERTANLEGWPLFVWTVADGLKRVPRTDVVTQTYEFQDALRHIDKTPQNGVYVLIDAQPYFENPVNVRLVKEIAQEYYKTARTLMFIVAAIYEALAVKQPLSTQHLLGEIAHTQPLSVVMAEKVGALRQWAAGRTVKAE
jgi:hypothetical protein